MLDVRSLSAAYGKHPSLQDVSLTVTPGEIVVILGANGAGKSTLLRAISGVCEGALTGEVSLDSHPLQGLSPDQIVERGVALVPEGRGIFGELTVRENLMLGAYSKRARADEVGNLERVLRLFPKLQERQTQIARTMSGGEQQMVAIGRAMMSNPQILMLDEPSLGLSPLLCKELFHNLKEVKQLGIGVLLVEQNAKQSLAIADRGYLLENTRISAEDTAANLARDPAVQKAYLGVSAKPKPTTPAATPEQAALPNTPIAPTRPHPRRTAEQQIGLSIDDLVQTATRQSAEPHTQSTPSPAGPGHDTRLKAVLHDIERAAAEARQHTTPQNQPVQKSDGIPMKVRQNSDAPLPVIEIYKRPRVEIYRRRPNGSFDRD